jgi:hypothetical protein
VAFLKFSRDKRGYEHFYLLQPSHRGKSRPRLLYWFRTPPGVKIGRSPFEPDVRRALEAQNPDVVFDWESIVHTPIPPPAEAERWRERRRVERAFRAAEQSEEAEAGRGSAQVPIRSDPPMDQAPETPVDRVIDSPIDRLESVEHFEPVEYSEPVDRLGPVEHLEPVDRLEPVEAEGTFVPDHAAPSSPQASAVASSAETGERAGPREGNRRRRRWRGRRRPQNQAAGPEVQNPGEAGSDDAEAPDLDDSAGPDGPKDEV